MPFKTPGQTSAYIRSLLRLRPAPDPIDCEMISYADAHMIAVLLPETTAFLRQAVSLVRPHRILEIGTAIGYSGIQMLRRAAPDAVLYTIEADEERGATAGEFFAKAGVRDRVTFYVGDATDIVPALTGSYDFIFLDGPKAQYVEYLPFLSRLLSVGGALFCDNVLYDGMVSGEAEIRRHKGGLVRKLDLFLHKLMCDDTLDTSILPVGDGVSFSRKISRREV